MFSLIPLSNGFHIFLHLLGLMHHPETCQLWSIEHMENKAYMYGQFWILITEFDNAANGI